MGRPRFAGVLQQPGVQIREPEFRPDQVFVQSDVELLRDTFRRRVLRGQTGVPGERVGRAKRTGNTRGKPRGVTTLILYIPITR